MTVVLKIEALENMEMIIVLYINLYLLLVKNNADLWHILITV